MSSVADFMARHGIPGASPEPEAETNALIPAPKQEQEQQDKGWEQGEAAMAAMQELRENSGNPHVEKMINTIVALINARLAGDPETAVFNQPDTCNVTTYYKKWKSDPDFSKCMDALNRVATEWKDSRHVRALKSASERLQLSAPVAAAKLLSLLGSSDPNIVFKAAVAILDRAGVETASKEHQIMNFIMNKIDFSKLSLEQIEGLQNAATPTDVIEVLMQ